MLPILVIANGSCEPATIQRCGYLQPQCVICVDGGLRHCVAARITPDVLIGDLDSADASLVANLDTTRTQCIRYSPDKDATDLELALQYVNDTFVESAFRTEDPLIAVKAHKGVEVCVVGISGGRTDHMLANWLVLSSIRWHFNIVVKDDAGTGYIVRPGNPRVVTLAANTAFSLLALQPCAGIECTGARYPLSDATLYPDIALGISNVSTTGNVRVSVKSGALLLYANDNGI